MKFSSFAHGRSVIPKMRRACAKIFNPFLVLWFFEERTEKGVTFYIIWVSPYNRKTIFTVSCLYLALSKDIADNCKQEHERVDLFTVYA